MRKSRRTRRLEGASVPWRNRQHRTLTKRTADRLSVNGKDAVFWDNELPDFGVRVYPSGKRVFVVHTHAFGRSKRVSLGTHGDTDFSVDLVPAFGERLVADIKYNDILAFHNSLHQMPTVANPATAIPVKILNLADAWG